MTGRRVDVIGGGPAGLYAARLLKLRDPALEVTVYERMSGAAETFGFGVGLTESTMTNLDAADPETAARIRARSFAGHDLRLLGPDGSVVLHGARNLAIGRAALLDVLASAAREVGVVLRSGVAIDAAATDADVVIAADGVHSATREKYVAELGVHRSLGRTRYVWCGADFAVASAFFAAIPRGEGVFVAHAYPYAPDRSTFLIEVDETTWHSCGLDEFDRGVAPGESDERSLALLSEIFAGQLDGRALLANRSRWSRFNRVCLDRWSVDNVVLLGDAAHTAHYTLGSGTKLALEDAIAVADALSSGATIGTAFAAYESTRRPAVKRFQELASRSEAWWDTYRLRGHLSPERLALSYMTRSGNLGLRDYAVDQPDVARRALSWLVDDVPREPSELEAWVLARPLHGVPAATGRVMRAAEVPAGTETVTWRDTDVWGAQADAVVGRFGAEGPPVLITKQGGGGLSTRLDLAERLRLQTSRCIGVELAETDLGAAATAVAAGRVDFVVAGAD